MPILKNRLDYAYMYTQKTKKLMDLGCDYGDFSVNYVKKAELVIAVDPNKKVIAAARKKNARNRLKFVVAPAEKLPFPDSYFDTITMTDCFEHVMNENKTIKEVYRVLKPNGKLIFSVPYKGMFRFLDPFNMKYYLPGLYKWFKGKAYNPNIYKEAPWHRHYTLNELKGYFKGRFEIEKKHRGGLFLYPFCALLFDSIFWKLKNTPKFILNFIDAIGKLDYMISYGPLAYHITLRAICVKKK